MSFEHRTVIDEEQHLIYANKLLFSSFVQQTCILNELQNENEACPLALMSAPCRPHFSIAEAITGRFAAGITSRSVIALALQPAITEFASDRPDSFIQLSMHNFRLEPRFWVLHSNHKQTNRVLFKLELY